MEYLSIVNRMLGLGEAEAGRLVVELVGYFSMRDRNMLAAFEAHGVVREHDTAWRCA